MCPDYHAGRSLRSVGSTASLLDSSKDALGSFAAKLGETLLTIDCTSSKSTASDFLRSVILVANASAGLTIFLVPRIRILSVIGCWLAAGMELDEFPLPGSGAIGGDFTPPRAGSADMQPAM